MFGGVAQFGQSLDRSAAPAYGAWIRVWRDSTEGQGRECVPQGRLETQSFEARPEGQVVERGESKLNAGNGLENMNYRGRWRSEGLRTAVKCVAGSNPAASNGLATQTAIRYARTTHFATPSKEHKSSAKTQNWPTFQNQVFNTNKPDE